MAKLQVSSLESLWLHRLIHTNQKLQKITFSSRGCKESYKGDSYIEIFDKTISKKREDFYHFIRKLYIPQYVRNGAIRSVPGMFIGYVIDVGLFKEVDVDPRTDQQLDFPSKVEIDPAESFAGSRTGENER